MIIKLNVLVPLERGGDLCRACPGQTNNAADGGRSDPGLPLRHPSPVILFRHLCALAGLRALPRLGQVRHHFHTLLLSALLLGGAHVVRLAHRDVRIIGFRVQYFGDIKDRDVLGILLGVSQFAYFTNSLCFSHFCKPPSSSLIEVHTLYLNWNEEKFIFLPHTHPMMNVTLNVKVNTENTHHSGKDHYTARLQLNWIWQDKTRKYVVICTYVLTLLNSNQSNRRSTVQWYFFLWESVFWLTQLF